MGGAIFNRNFRTNHPRPLLLLRIRWAVPTDQQTRFHGVQLTFIILKSQSRLVT